MSVKTKEIIEHCNKYLKVENFQDYCASGLQVEGAEEVSKVVMGVSWSKELIDIAIEKKAGLVIVHHGFFKDMLGEFPVVEGFMKERLKVLFDNNINLAGYHLPLDAHPVIGNNISILNVLNLKKVDVMKNPVYGEIGFVGEYDEAMDVNAFVDAVNEKLNTKSYTVLAGPDKVKRVGIVSGGASPDFLVANALGCDTFISGDVREGIIHPVKEIGMNFINAGHYNSERFGVINLGELIAKEFGVDVEFVEIPCDV